MTPTAIHPYRTSEESTLLSRARAYAWETARSAYRQARVGCCERACPMFPTSPRAFPAETTRPRPPAMRVGAAFTGSMQALTGLWAQLIRHDHLGRPRRLRRGKWCNIAAAGCLPSDSRSGNSVRPTGTTQSTSSWWGVAEDPVRPTRSKSAWKKRKQRGAKFVSVNRTDGGIRRSPTNGCAFVPVPTA